MPVVFKNPNLPDYFLELPQVRADMPLTALPSIVEPFEAGKVITFPNLKFDIDPGFWAGLPTDAYPKLKKVSSRPRPGKPDQPLDEALKAAGIPIDLETALRAKIAAIYDQVLPVYEALFSGYEFTRRQVVWRLNTIMNEPMHVDTYWPEQFPDHFARLFINLDDQPRIWKTSWPIADMYRLFADKVPAERAAVESDDEYRYWLNRAAFSPKAKSWWDNEPRHVVYFQPGDVWAVDSRQVAHQIFYGRRAVSIDFFVDRKSMGKPGRHYLKMAERLRAKAAPT